MEHLKCLKLLCVFFTTVYCVTAAGYHNYTQLTEALKNITDQYPHITKLRSIGQSTEGRELWVVEISAVTNTSGVPNVKLIGNIHGNEPVGKEVLLFFLEDLVSRYSAKDYEIVSLLNTTRIHIFPSMNPDGYERAIPTLCNNVHGRNNARDVDLNRSFPNFFLNTSATNESETIAVQKWMDEIPFILSISFHGGAMVVNYPYESSGGIKNGKRGITKKEFTTPDNDIVKSIATEYAANHETMYKGNKCSDKQRSFENGITNGYAWYPVSGGMQDYNYIQHGCLEFTIEISCCKFPPYTTLKGYWKANRKAIYEFTKNANKGVKGFITDMNGDPVGNATLKIKNRDIVFNSTKDGEFWRILLPGTYTLEVSKGHDKLSVDFKVDTSKATVLNIVLLPTMSTTEFEKYDNDLYYIHDNLLTDNEESVLIASENIKPEPVISCADSNSIKEVLGKSKTKCLLTYIFFNIIIIKLFNKISF